MVIASALVCLALNIYHESRGESIIGQHAVAQVTLNRAKRDPDNVCKEVVKRKQFSWTNGLGIHKTKGGYKLPPAALPKELAAWERAKKVAMAALERIDGPDLFAGGATFYHALHVKPDWSYDFKQVATIGRHRFYTPT